MTIEFFCPNEHQLSAPDNMAGKAGKCPRCGSKFLIPTLEELQEEHASEPAPSAATGGGSDKRSSSGVGRGGAESPKAGAASSTSKKLAWQGAPTTASPAAAESSAAKKKGDEPTSAGETSKSATRRAVAALPPGHFMFLCPNNHKLNGPLSLKGKPGQCPHCGAKFRIPDDAEDDGTQEPPTDDRASGSGKGSRAPSAADEIVEEGIIVDTEPEAEEIPAVEPISVWQLPPPPPGQGHRLAELFAWVWAQREQNAVIELTLKDDETFVPKWFAAELSVEGYGSFATEDEFGRYSLHVLPWDSIQRLVVRQLEDLPPQFE